MVLPDRLSLVGHRHPHRSAPAPPPGQTPPPQKAYPRLLRFLRLRPPRHPRPLPRMRYNSRQAKRMKRLRRIIFNTLTVLSLVLFVAVCVLWARSYSWYDRAMWAGRKEYGRVQSLNARVVFELTTDYPLENQSSMTSEQVGDNLRGFDWAVGLAAGWR